MAITFSKALSEEKLLLAFNNNVVRFSSDNEQAPVYCDITGLGIDVRIYPNPTGGFYFNFKEYFATIVNTKKFVDDLDTDISDGDPDSFTYDVSDGCFKGGDLSFEIFFPDNTSESVSRTISIIAGVVQLEDYKRQEIDTSGDYIILSPVQSRSNNTVNLWFWEGYPFEFSFYTNQPTTGFKLKNIANGINHQFTAKGSVTSICLSDGRTDVSIEDLLPLVVGVNEIHILDSDDNDLQVNINLEKFDSDCGVYVKWLNHLGRWNYWLLSKTNFRDRSSKYDEELASDFEDVENTFAPTVQSGKTSSDVLKCNSGRLTQKQKEVFIGIFESMKVYLFCGDRFSRSSSSDWVEVTLKSTSARVNSKKNSYNIDFDLPTRYAQFQ